MSSNYIVLHRDTLMAEDWRSLFSAAAPLGGDRSLAEACDDMWCHFSFAFFCNGTYSEVEEGSAMRGRLTRPEDKATLMLDLRRQVCADSS